MSVHGQTIIQWFEQHAPKHLALDGDKIGLQIGTLQKEVTHVLITLDVTPEVVQEAIDNQVNLIIAHHPIIYRPLPFLRTDKPYGKMIEQLMKHNITVYIAHTNLDVAEGGVNDLLAEKLGLNETEVLSPTASETLKKLIVFVPKQNEAELRKALGDAGAGHIGDYSHCSFRSEGVGTFLPGSGTSPHIGTQGKLEQVNEVKIETIFPASIEKKVLNAMIKSHPYEEVAYDIYKLEQKGKTVGLGRIGYLREEMSLKQFAEHVKVVFDVPRCRVIGDMEKSVKKVAVLGGDGNKYMNDASFKGADVFVTGDVYFHTAHDALMNGLNVVDPGHHVEKVMMEGVSQWLKEEAEKNRSNLNVSISRVHTEPFIYV